MVSFPDPQKEGNLFPMIYCGVMRYIRPCIKVLKKCSKNCQPLNLFRVNIGGENIYVMEITTPGDTATSTTISINTLLNMKMLSKSWLCSLTDKLGYYTRGYTPTCVAMR